MIRYPRDKGRKKGKKKKEVEEGRTFSTTIFSKQCVCPVSIALNSGLFLFLRYEITICKYKPIFSPGDRLGIRSLRQAAVTPDNSPSGSSLARLTGIKQIS